VVGASLSEQGIGKNRRIQGLTPEADRAMINR
jgi:hypothetical protein